MQRQGLAAQVHVRGRLELVSGKGKACFLKIRQRMHTIQACPCACILGAVIGYVGKPTRLARLQAPWRALGALLALARARVNQLIRVDAPRAPVLICARAWRRPPCS